MSHMTTVKTTRETLDRIRPYAVFRESWDTALNHALDMLDDLKSEVETKEIVKQSFEEKVDTRTPSQILLDKLKD